MNSKHIKCALLHYFRFKRGYLCVDECNSGFREKADILVAKGNTYWEVEIKISKADLLKEKNKKKHKAFKNQHQYYKPEWGANKFYICVPEELKEYAEKWIKEINPKYGLLIYNHNKGKYSWGIKWQDRISVSKPAKFLHKNRDFNKRQNIIDRLSSALVNTYANELELIEAKQKLEEHS